jgi:hypothetical protein
MNEEKTESAYDKWNISVEPKEGKFLWIVLVEHDLTLEALNSYVISRKDCLLSGLTILESFRAPRSVISFGLPDLCMFSMFPVFWDRFKNNSIVNISVNIY